MQTKTEIEQLQDRKNEVWKSYSFQLNQIKIKQAEKKSMDNTFFRIKWQIRAIEEEIQQLETAVKFLYEYYQSLIRRIEQLEK